MPINIISTERTPDLKEHERATLNKVAEILSYHGEDGYLIEGSFQIADSRGRKIEKEIDGILVMRDCAIVLEVKYWAKSYVEETTLNQKLQRAFPGNKKKELNDNFLNPLKLTICPSIKGKILASLGSHYRGYRVNAALVVAQHKAESAPNFPPHPWFEVNGQRHHYALYEGMALSDVNTIFKLLRIMRLEDDRDHPERIRHRASWDVDAVYNAIKNERMQPPPTRGMVAGNFETTSALPRLTDDALTVFEAVERGVSSVIEDAWWLEYRRNTNLTGADLAYENLFIERTVAALSRFGPHPNIVEYKNTETRRDVVYVFLRRTAGVFLHEYMHPDLLLADRLSILANILDALAHIHTILDALAHIHTIQQDGTVALYRSLRPESVFIQTEGNRAQLFNLDCTRLPGRGTLSASDVTRKSYPFPKEDRDWRDYASPELLKGRELTPKTDVFSWGVLAYRLLTDALPFATDAQKAVGRFTPISVRAGNIGESLATLIDTALDLDPIARPSIETLQVAVREAHDGRA